MTGGGESPSEASESGGAPADAHFRRALEQSQVGVYVIQDGQYVYVNDRMAATFGYAPEELCDGMTPFDLVVEKDHEKLSDRLERRRAETGAPGPIVLECRRDDGEHVYVEARGCQIEYGGEPAVMGLVVDVTDRIEQERALQAERDRLRALFENAHGWSVDVTESADGGARFEVTGVRFASR